MGHGAGTGRILVVDDDLTIAETLKQIFVDAGYDCRAFHSAEAYLKHNDTVWIPDFALLDVILPGVDGLELAIHLRNCSPGTTITLFSGNTETEAVLERAQVSGHSFPLLAKPIHPNELLTLIVTSLARTKNVNLCLNEGTLEMSGIS